MGISLLLALAMAGQVPNTASPSAAPTDDYGYVSWCYGALGGYVELYDQVMPEVTRIEKAFPGPDGVEASLKTYPEMRAQARGDLKTFTAAITAAEKASPRPISEYGRAAINKGRSVWAGSDTANKARLAQVWMSWSPPNDCEGRAKALEKRSNILGKALIYNTAKPAEMAAPEAAVGEAPAPEPVMPDAAAPASAPATETETAPAPAAPVETPMAPDAPTAQPAPKTKVVETVIDPLDPKPCAGRAQGDRRGGKAVLVCKPD
jgi:hypothetical protein